MDKIKTINVYYKKIIDLILELYKDDFNQAIPGHCMKITGLGLNELEQLWDIMDSKYPNISTFIISEKINGHNKYITATKLIELRNNQESPLFILIPSNSRTAAEDSYGNATFKEISLEGIEDCLKNDLLNKIPKEYLGLVKDEIINYLSCIDVSAVNIINYLLALDERGYTKESVGNFIYLLNLIPDSSLILEEEKVRSRLNFNIKSTLLLSSFNKPLYERIADLSLEQNTIQKDLVDFIKIENDVRNSGEICKLIFEKYSLLNFSNWQIPDLNFTHIKLFIDDIKSNDFKLVEGKRILQAEVNKTSKVKIRFHTNPNPNDISDLYYFKIILMAVNGGAGDEISVLRKFKNSNSNRSYREATIELNSNMIEEGSYFFKVIAEDEHGNILNAADDFKDLKIQKARKEQKDRDTNESKSNFPFKLTCDSEDFDYMIEEAVERDETQRKNKLNNVLQAFLKFRIEKLKSDEEASIPLPMNNSNIWLGDKTRFTSTFYINYNDKHNYQINISSKLRMIEDLFLNKCDSFGYIKGILKSNSSAIGFELLKFEESALTSMVPKTILKLREEIFQKIKNSNAEKNGVFETADIFNFSDKIKVYLEKLTSWTSILKNQVLNVDLKAEEKTEIQHFLTELQFFDIARIRTKLPNGNPVEALLLSPLHPLRLTWFVQLLEVFKSWEKKTNDYSGYKESWLNNLDYLFEGELSPENNPLVLVEPGTFKNYHYSGEVAYGWALYLNVLSEESKVGMTSVSRQMKHYFRQLLNITKDDYVETDISQKLVVRHIKNYLAQHPYTDKLIINLINAGDANVFANAFVELEKDYSFKKIKYEVRIFKGNDNIIEHGEALRNLINPEFNVSEEAEAFSQPSKNRLFPKLRFSINNISDYLKQPSKFTSHISFLVSPFPITIELIKPYKEDQNFHLNALITDSTVSIDENGNEIKWYRFIRGNNLSINYDGSGEIGIKLYDNIQSFIAGALASHCTESIPATQLRLSDIDKVLLTQLHDFSDWVVTFDKNLGPQIFDQPSKDGKIPFLLDYVPGEEITGISSYLTTRPTSEILGLLGPHFEEFDLNIHNPDDEKKIKILLEDLRAISSSLVLQLNSSKNKAFEVIGSAFTKRVLEKKRLLEESFLIPIDLHQNLFEGLPNKSRADNLLISIDLDKKEILISVLEIKCRKSLTETEKFELKIKMQEQIDNTIEAFRFHFDSDYHLSFDRLDREIKNKELKSLLAFYIERAYRYEYLSENAFRTYSSFIQYLDDGFKLKFKQLGLIFDFSEEKKHQKEVFENDLTFFTFGIKLIEEILNPDSDLNTRRLEDNILDDELRIAIGSNYILKPFILKFKAKKEEHITHNFNKLLNLNNETNETIEYPVTESNVNYKVAEKDNTNLYFENSKVSETNSGNISPTYDLLIGRSSLSNQYGILGESIHGKKIAIDLSGTNTISLFGVQGGGKSYTIGTISEMVLKQFNNINELPAPLAGVIFHYSESMDYKPEFTSMIYPNDKLSELTKLKEIYGAEPDNIQDVIILTPKDKVDERQAEYPSIKVLPISFNSKELNVQDWLFILGAVGNDSTYIKQLKAIMKEHRKNITLDGITNSVNQSDLLSNSQKTLARQKLNFASEYIDDDFMLRDSLRPGRLIIVDLRDEFIVKDEALGLFVIMLNIFSAVKNANGSHFNKFIVFDEAHKYMNNKDLTGNIVTAIREMRHKGVNIMIASQDPPSLPNEIIELSSIVLLHKFNSPQWLKHIQKSITQLSVLSPADMSVLAPGEAFLWATKATEKNISTKPVKISTRPRVTKHGGGTVQAVSHS